MNSRCQQNKIYGVAPRAPSAPVARCQSHHEYEGSLTPDFGVLRDQLCTTQGPKLDGVKPVDSCWKGRTPPCGQHWSSYSSAVNRSNLINHGFNESMIRSIQVFKASPAAAPAGDFEVDMLGMRYKCVNFGRERARARKIGEQPLPPWTTIES